jgi:hypothetical protein
MKEIEPKPLSNKTARLLRDATENLLQTQGFSLPARIVRIPEYLEADYDMSTISLEKDKELGVLRCFITRPTTPTHSMRNTIITMHEDDEITHTSIEIEILPSEYIAMTALEVTYDLWEVELSRLHEEGLLNKDEEEEKLHGLLQKNGQFMQQYLDVQQLKDKAESAEEKQEAELLLQYIETKVQIDRSNNEVEALEDSKNDNENLTSYIMCYRRLLAAYGDVMSAQSDQTKRAMAALVGSPWDALREDEAWQLLRTLDKVADLE